jgi:hypothetical protein
MQKSPLFSISLNDTGKAIIMLLITGFVTTLGGSLLPVLTGGGFPTWIELVDILKFSLATALASGFSYILKNMFTNSDGKFAKKEGAE